MKNIFKESVIQTIPLATPENEYIKVIEIPLDEYKELLTYKGKYLGLRERYVETTKYYNDKPILTKIDTEIEEFND